jgi:hypothetical protein
MSGGIDGFDLSQGLQNLRLVSVSVLFGTCKRAWEMVLDIYLKSK